MAKKVRVTLSIDGELARELGKEVRRLRISRSKLVEDAIRLWRRRKLEEEMERGYRDLAAGDRELAEEFLPACSEAIE